jgi:mono/diheme cytochrome c family protein
MKKLALLAISAAFTLAVSTNALAADGKAVFTDTCVKCHGDDGKGQTKMGQKLGARDYSDPKVQDSFTDEDAFKAIKEGMKKDDKTLMRPSELADDDIKASVTYLRTLKK